MWRSWAQARPRDMDEMQSWLGIFVDGMEIIAMCICLLVFSFLRSLPTLYPLNLIILVNC